MISAAFSLENIKKMAENISFVSFDMIQIKDAELKSHWYKHDHIDLYYYQNSNGDLVKFHISLFGQVLEWNALAGVRTGLLVEEEKQNAVFEMIQYDERANPGTMAQALLVLRNAQAVESPVREELMEYITATQAGKSSSKKSFAREATFKDFWQWFLSCFR